MTETEKLHFKIELAGTYWKKVPAFSIFLNDDVINFKREIETASGESFFVEFDAEVEDSTECVLKIRLDNKDITDVVKDDETSENFKIVKDMLLHIRSVEIDEIDLGILISTKSSFVGDDATRPVLDNCVDLGWNGTWALTFESPFYIWLLENI